MDFYRGYVDLTEKKSKRKFKDVPNEKLLTLEEAKKHCGYAGILAKDAILIDVDTQAQSEILLKIIEAENVNCRVYKTTRGMHFLFRNESVTKTGTKLRLAVGLMADVKSGLKNGYQALKVDGVEREILHDVQGEAADFIPKWLYPLESKIDLFNLNDGDGRNDAIFRYILPLTANGFTKEEARTCLRIINKFIFTKPLSESEFNTATRDEAFAAVDFGLGAKFKFNEFALYLKDAHYVIKIDDQLHFYNEGFYITGRKLFGAIMLEHIPVLSTAKRNEVYNYLDELITQNTPRADVRYIAFRNGLYDIETGEFLPPSPELVITNYIPWDYNPKAESKLADNALNNFTCENVELRRLLEEVIGYTFYRSNNFGAAVMLLGNASNGKSTFLDMLRTTLGKSNVSSLDLKDVGERFGTAELFGKLANICDDISNEFIPDTGVFKKLVTGEAVKGERKGQDPFFFASYAKLLFSANVMPRLGRGKDWEALKRRLIIIPFEARFSPDDPDYDPHIKEKLTTSEVSEYMILLGLRGLKRLLTTKRFTRVQSVVDALEDYEKMNNPLLGFFEEVPFEEIINEPTKKIYRKYQEYCIRDNLQRLSKIEFSKRTKEHFNLAIVQKKISGENLKTFISQKGI
jgi:putative DNA primase/helicase